ncbi:Acg family FMN-binding oxidoreductase [Rubrivirga sp. IMCC45206]|uniref:Acg family FMN-binding oxidoreductase n=1 Tax=Rubrivirga sp. IMCC45206 TaxID=3391614 RepID=UPI00398FD0CA
MPTAAPPRPRAVTDADFPSGPPEAQLEAMLNWAVLAPSVLNTQPWRFRVVPGPAGPRAEVSVDRARVVRSVDPEGREAVISCGAALLTLRLAARHFGFVPDVHLAGPDAAPDLVGTVRLEGAARPTAAEEALFRAIKLRHTNRDPFADLPVPVGLLARLQGAARAEGARLHVVTSVSEKGALADLVAEAILEQGDDPAMVADLRAWLRPVGDTRPDGVPDDVQGGWDRLSYLHTEARFVAAQTRRLAAMAPALLVIATPGDSRADRARAGQALQRVLLLAALDGLAASYFNQPTKVARLRPEVSAVAGVGQAQVVFRLGTPIEAQGTPRRPVPSVVEPDDAIR